jgi:hypothetical protein
MKGGAMCTITVGAVVKVVRWRTLAAAEKRAGQHRPAQPRLHRRTLAAADMGRSGEPQTHLTETDLKNPHL